MFLLPTGSSDIYSAHQWGGGPRLWRSTRPAPGRSACSPTTSGLSRRTGYPAPDVSATFVQPFISYTTPDAWTFTLQSESTYDWNAGKWQIPVSAVVSKVLKIGPQLISVGGGVRYYATSPDSLAKGWGGRLVLTFLFQNSFVFERYEEAIAMRANLLKQSISVACTLLFAVQTSAASACTGVTLKAGDGAVVFGRTLEWGSFDLMSRLEIVPRGLAYKTHMPDGKAGLSWTGKYGAVGIDAVGKDMIIEGMNEKGLDVGLFYHPDFAKYEAYDPEKAAESLGPTDLGQYLLTNFATVDEVRAAIDKIRVVAVVEPALGFAPPVHFIVTEPSGKAIVIEYAKGQLQVFDAPLGVITNAPTYDWHETNLRNYINLSPVAIPEKKLEDLNFKPLGGGSGMIGLPGDFTPPSRFIRAVAFSQTARPTATGDETIYEIFPHPRQFQRASRRV